MRRSGRSCRVVLSLVVACAQVKVIVRYVVAWVYKIEFDLVFSIILCRLYENRDGHLSNTRVWVLLLGFHRPASGTYRSKSGHHVRGDRDLQAGAGVNIFTPLVVYRTS